MAVATSTAVLAGISVAGGIAKTIDGAKRKKAAKKAAAAFKRQELKNVHRNRRISTRGAELQQTEQARATATSVDALQQGGIRGVVGGMGSVQEANNRAAAQIGAGLDEQQVMLDRDIADDDAEIRYIQEGRDNQELQTIQGQMNAAHQDMWGGIGDIASGAGAMASGLQGSIGGGGAGSISKTTGISKDSYAAAVGAGNAMRGITG